MSQVCVLSPQEYLELTDKGIRPNCQDHRHENRKRANELIEQGFAQPTHNPFCILNWGNKSQRTPGKWQKNVKREWKVVNRWSFPSLQLVDY